MLLDRFEKKNNVSNNMHFQLANLFVYSASAYYLVWGTVALQVAFKDTEENSTSWCLPSSLHVKIQFWIHLNISMAVEHVVNRAYISLYGCVTLNRSLFQSLIDCSDGGERFFHYVESLNVLVFLFMRHEQTYNDIIPFCLMGI